jgi:hypothetical protein
MKTTWLEQRRQRERDDIAARKRRDEAKADPNLEQCLIAYHAFRVGGGQMAFADFRRDWYTTKGAMDGR